MVDKPSPIVMEEVTDSEELAKARAQRERFDRNSAWLQAHIAEIYARYRGKCICILGEELFVADTPKRLWHWRLPHILKMTGAFSVTSTRKAGSHLCALMGSGCCVMMVLGGL